MSQRDIRRAPRKTQARQPRAASLLWAATLVALFSLVAPAWAEQVGVIATFDGAVEIERAGEWQAAVVGASIEIGDRIRTGQPGRVRLVFRDESVLSLGDGSLIVIDSQVFDPAASKVQSLFRLLQGKVRAIVSDVYRDPLASFEAETPTAVSGVRGTDFVMIYDPETMLTQVVGISGSVEVRSTTDRQRAGVIVGPQEITEVASGRFPSPARRIDEATFQEYVAPFEFIGLGLPEGLSFLHPLVGGAVVPPEDRLEARSEVKPDSEPLPLLGGSGSIDGEPEYETRGVPDAIDQPPRVVDGDGEIGIEF